MNDVEKRMIRHIAHGLMGQLNGGREVAIERLQEAIKEKKDIEGLAPLLAMMCSAVQLLIWMIPLLKDAGMYAEFFQEIENGQMMLDTFSKKFHGDAWDYSKDVTEDCGDPDCCCAREMGDA